MKTCEDFAALVCQHADRSLEGSQLDALRVHLTACPACARDAAVQLAVHDTLRDRASALREPVPQGLQARLAALVQAPTVVPFQPSGRAAGQGRRWAMRRFVPVSLAAGLLMAVAAGLLAPSGSVLAAQLALDHLKCRLIATTTPGTAPEELERRWQAERGWAVDVPASSARLGVSLVGIRRCLYHDGTMAHLMYDLRGHRLSLFVMPHGRADAHALTVLGQQTVTWTKGGRAYAVVAADDAGDLGPVAAYFHEAAH